MKHNLKIKNIVMSGRIPLNVKRISVDVFNELIMKHGWMDMSLGENYGSRFSKKFFIRNKKEMSVHHKEKAPYVTIFALGGIIIVGLKNKKEADVIYNLVIKDIKKVSKGLIKNTLK